MEDRPGRGRAIFPGDRIRVELTGRYASGEVWGRGPLTLVVGAGTYPGSSDPLRVGSVVRMQYVVRPSDTTARLWPFQGGDPENEAYQPRHDRGQIIVEHKVLDACRPLKLFLLQTGFGPIESDIGCWRLPRAAPPRVDPRLAEIERMVEDANSGAPSSTGGIFEPPPVPRQRADTARFVGADGLHRAAREARPEIVGWLIARGADPSATDIHGFAPIHYVGFAQKPFERFVPALEQSYLDVVDTLLAHGAAVDAPVQAGAPRASTSSEREHEGQTALAFAGAECADRLVALLLARGANPNAHGVEADPPITGAARNGCPETVRLLLSRGATVDYQPRVGGTPLERLASVSAFHEGHVVCARLLAQAGANVAVTIDRLKARLDDPGPGGFGFSNRPQARRILDLLRHSRR